MIYQRTQINNLISRLEDPLVIRPLLEPDQIGEVSIDLRLGTDFLVSVNNRETTLASNRREQSSDNIRSFFQETRRRPGESFLLHPNQIVLASTLEYVRIPKVCAMEIKVRNSYSRLGLQYNTVVQPGYCGVICVELINASKHIIELTVGARVFNGFIHDVTSPSNYFHSSRKYMCAVRPEISAIYKDKEFQILNKYANILNHYSE